MPRGRSRATSPVQPVAPLQLPYPELPRTPLRDPACAAGASTGRRTRPGRRRPPLHPHGTKQPAAGTASPSQDLAQQSASSALAAALKGLPPGLGEAMADLSRGVLRSKWHCERLAADRPGPGALTSTEGQEEENSGVSQEGGTLGHESAGTEGEELTSEWGRYRSFDEEAAAVVGGLFQVREADGDVEDAVRSATAPSASLPRRARRLEVVLRGTFRTPPAGGAGSKDDDDEDDEDDDEVRRDFTRVSTDVVHPEAEKEENMQRASTCSPFKLPPPVPRGRRGGGGSGPSLPGGEDSDSEGDDVMRELMGFGRSESGAMPSGRTSVPGGRIHCKSAPPLRDSMRVDEGIPLDGVAEKVEEHVRRALVWSLRGGAVSPAPTGGAVWAGSQEFPSHDARGSSASPSPGCSVSPRWSPTPQRSTGSSSAVGGTGSPPRCATPCGLEDLRLSISLRLCRTRCGSSSAVLELTLGHCGACREAFRAGGDAECLCWPRPEDAETRLLTYFTRHTVLRWASVGPSVKVQLEPLPDRDDEEE